MVISGAGFTHRPIAASTICPNEAAGACRPYDPTSPWNTPVPANPSIDPNSAGFINAIADNGLPLTSDPNQYALPVYIFDEHTPRVTVQLRGGYWNAYDSGDDVRTPHGYEPLIADVPLPTGAGASQGTDGQIIMWNPTTGEQWEFWQWRAGQNTHDDCSAPSQENDVECTDDYTGRGTYFDKGTTSIDLCNYTPTNPPAGASSNCYVATNATRYHTKIDDNGKQYYGRFNDSGGGRGAGTPYLAGLVRPWEIDQGHIDHALAFAYNTPAPTPNFRYPATKTDGLSVSGLDVPEGARLQLDPSLTDADFTAMGLGASARVMARALQQYGMYLIDNSGSSKIFMEDGITAHWDTGQVNRDILSGIPWSSFRVLSVSVTQPPPDAYAPSVSISYPAVGSTVSGSAVSVPADASDNEAVVGVQFQLDGVNLGAEDMTAPYTTTWNTTATSDGSHSLTAVARDAAGNTTTSSTIAVTVANASPPATPTCSAISGTNLALGQTATASSVQPSSLVADNAIDGDAGTRWASVFDDAQWLQLDLGSVRHINQVKLDWEDAYASSYQILVSNDASHWTTIYSTTTGSGGCQNLTGLSASGRYVRMSGIARSTIYGYSLWEFGVYGNGSDTTAPTVSITLPVNGAPPVTGTITPTVAAADGAGVSTVELYIDDLLAATDVAAPYVFSWDTTVYSNTTHTLSAKAYDAAHNVTTSSPITVSVDNPVVPSTPNPPPPTPAPSPATPPPSAVTPPVASVTTQRVTPATDTAASPTDPTVTPPDTTAQQADPAAPMPVNHDPARRAKAPATHRFPYLLLIILIVFLSLGVAIIFMYRRRRLINTSYPHA